MSFKLDGVETSGNRRAIGPGCKEDDQVESSEFPVVTGLQTLQLLIFGQKARDPFGTHFTEL